MHDPKTVAFDIKRPWPQRRSINNLSKWRYYPSLLVIWHQDTEADGSDDACGWFSPKLNAEQKKVCEDIARDLLSDVFHKEEDSNLCSLKCTSESAVYSTYIRVGWRVFRKRHLSARHLNNVLDLMFNRMDNMLPSAEVRFDDVQRMVHFTARSFAKIERPWWRHPRWHIHHWQIQIPLLQSFKRWAFSRCCRCKKSFSWGYAPMSSQWDGTGPLWFRSEEGVYHSDCSNPKNQNAQCEAARS
jgi:hypothetical protein